MSTSNEAVFLEFVSRWGEGNAPMADRVRELFTEDCTWSQPGLPTTTGPEEAADLVMGLDAMGMTSIKIEMRNVASVGDVVFTERVDDILAADGTVLMSVDVVGVTEFRDGKISAWREYFDTAGLAPPAE